MKRLTKPNKLKFLSTPSGWRATTARIRAAQSHGGISIHALRVEGDNWRLEAFSDNSWISIHALRVEGDLAGQEKLARGEISIHALRVEGDRLSPTLTRGRCSNFYPRPPGGGRHERRARTRAAVYISIHALRVEGDVRVWETLSTLLYFYPRPPGGGRRAPFSYFTVHPDFYPRPPGGGRHVADTYAVKQFYFYPRPPGGGRQSAFSGHVLNHHFYPRPPGGGRPDVVQQILSAANISIHALRVEGDSKNGQSFHLFLRKREKKLPL